MQTFPCGHRVVCRRCFVKTIQAAVSQRLLPLRCVVCRAKILRLKQTTQGGIDSGAVLRYRQRSSSFNGRNLSGKQTFINYTKSLDIGLANFRSSSLDTEGKTFNLIKYQQTSGLDLPTRPSPCVISAHSFASSTPQQSPIFNTASEVFEN